MLCPYSHTLSIPITPVLQLMVLSLCEYHINEVIQYVTFYHQLLLFNVMPLRVIQVVAHIKNLFLLITK